MNELFMAMYLMCVRETLPNVNTIKMSLTEEQRYVLAAYTEEKCKQEAAIKVKKHNKRPDLKPVDRFDPMLKGKGDI